VEGQNLKENDTRASIVLKIFWALIVINIIAIAFSYYQYDLLGRYLDGEIISDDKMNMNDLRQGLVGLLQGLVYLVIIITFLSWFRRAYANLHRMGIDYLEHSEQQAIWGFIIPIINLYRPYKIMKEVWVETQDQIKKLDESFKVERSADLVGVWWGLFLLSNVVTNVALRIGFRADTLEQLQNASLAQMVSDFIDIPAAFAAIVVIRRVSRFETLLIRNRGY
jgi:hypothetical protein